ncbi:hypothetical protein KKC60_02870 [Patescibacteria group bacterium]|nr:hypothetical protein [Patescibacteria group bacterium]
MNMNELSFEEWQAIAARFISRQTRPSDPEGLVISPRSSMKEVSVWGNHETSSYDYYCTFAGKMPTTSVGEKDMIVVVKIQEGTIIIEERVTDTEVSTTVHINENDIPEAKLE